MSQGLQFHKFDLHVHTPASDDYKEKNIQASDIVNAAIAKELKGIAISDHMTGKWIDRVKKAVKGKDLVVFPAVELKVTGGKEGIHLILIFNVDKGTDHVDAFLHRIKVYQFAGRPTVADKTAVEVAEELQQFDPDAIMILAHCDSSFGVSSCMRGEQRQNIFKPELKCLVGAETNESNFINYEKKSAKTRVVDLFDGTNTDYLNKRLGVFQSSDAHSIAEIGTRFTYFKVDEPITIEDIRQSLLDRETRIRQSFDYQHFTFPRIQNIRITSGFLLDQEILFHEGLNSILGAKGSGKSLVIEFLRFALNQEPTNADIRSDHIGKLEKCLKVHGEVYVRIIDDSEKIFQIKRTYNPADANPIVITDPSDDKLVDFKVEEIFPVLFLSQNEIIKIAEDKSGKSQREFIDKFFDFHRYQQKIDYLNSELADIDQRLVEILKARITSIDLESKIKSHNEEIHKLGRQIKNSVFEKFSKNEKIGQALQAQSKFLLSLKSSLMSTEVEYVDYKTETSDDLEVSQNPQVKRVHDIVSGVLSKITDSIKEARRNLEQEQQKVTKEIEDWKTGFRPIKQEYENIVKETGGNQVSLDQKRRKLMSNLSFLQSEHTKLKGKVAQAKTVVDKRKETIRKLEKAYKEYFEERKSRCDFFTKTSGGALDVTIKEREDKTTFRENLIKFKRGSWLKEDEIESITEKMDPNDFISDILAYEWACRKGSQATERLQNIASITGIKLENIRRLVEHLLDNYELKDILAILYTSTPKDVPNIKYRVGDEFRVLSELSVGQKAVALLIIALSDGTFPIVIDQPEDSLDLRSIWDDVCTKIRGNKEKRQFIFTTHNSSVAVASDTDKFSIMRADATHGEVVNSGSLNLPNIKKQVIDYLEGGESTYHHKRQK